MPERHRGADRAQAADTVALSAHMRPKPAMHRNPVHLHIATITGMVARDVGDQPRREQPHIPQPSTGTQHLIKRHHAARRRKAAATRQPGRPELGGIVTGFRRVGVRTAALLLRRHADEYVVAQSERFDHPRADHVAVILAGDRLDHHRLHQVRRLAVVLQLRSRGPIQREVADLGAHPRMVGPGRLGDVVVRKAALMRHHLFQRDVGFATCGKLRQVVGYLVHEGQFALLHQRPHRRTGQHLGLTEQQEQRVVRRRLPRWLGLRIAIGAEQRQLPVPRQGDLRAGIAAFLDMLLDQPVEMLDRPGSEAKAGKIAGRQRVIARHGPGSCGSPWVGTG